MDPDALMRTLARLHEHGIELVYDHAEGSAPMPRRFRWP